MKAPQRLETKRLVLRKPVGTDAGGIYARYAGDAEVTRFLGWPRHLSIDDTNGFIDFSNVQWRDHPCWWHSVHWQPAGPNVLHQRPTWQGLGRQKRLAQDIASINEHAHKLNSEMSDALSFQARMD